MRKELSNFIKTAVVNLKDPNYSYKHSIIAGFYVASVFDKDGKEIAGIKANNITDTVKFFNKFNNA